MQSLIEVSRIVTKKKVRKIEIFDDYTLRHKNSKFNEFYEGLLNNKFKNDRDAAAFLYNCTESDDKYRQLKSRFRKRLLNTLFFLDVNVPSNSTYDRSYYSVNKDWTLVKILIANNAEFTAASLARQILITALKYKFADVIVNCSRILRTFCANTSDEKGYEEYDQYIKQYSNVLDAEIRSEELYQRVIMNYYQLPQKSASLREKIDTYCEALVGLSEMYDSPIVIYNMYLVWAFRYEMLHDYEAMIEVCEKAEKYIEENPNSYQDEKLATFQLKKMSAYLHIRDYKRGKVNAEKCLKSFPSGTANWFHFMEYYILLAFHTENYVNALAILDEATTHPKFKRLSLVDREKWNLYEVYLGYISESSPDNPLLLQNQKRRNFRTNKFLADPILFPREQRIFTLHMVVAQALFYIEKKNFSQVEERIDRLKSYANRQLKKEDYFRAIQFIRLLQQLAKADFKVSDLTNVDKYYARLHKYPFFYRGLLTELEIIPFEKIWDIILLKLK